MAGTANPDDHIQLGYPMLADGKSNRAVMDKYLPNCAIETTVDLDKMTVREKNGLCKFLFTFQILIVLFLRAK